MAMEVYHPVELASLILVVVFVEQLMLVHLVIARSPAVLSRYDTTGRPSLPIAIEVSCPTLLASLILVVVFVEQLMLVHLVIARSPAVKS